MDEYNNDKKEIQDRKKEKIMEDGLLEVCSQMY